MQSVTSKSGLTGINAMAFDGAGDTYFTTRNLFGGSNGVYKMTAGGVITPIGTGWSYPQSVVVDGAGNVYVADIGLLYEVTKITPAGVQSTIPLSGSVSRGTLALDASGNLYANSGGYDIYKLTPAGTQSMVYESGPGVTSIAFSPTGQMYFTDANGNIYSVQGGVATLVSSATPGAQSIAFDAAGNLYATFNAGGGNLGVYELTPSAAVTQLVAEPNGENPQGLALDPSGNVYFGNNGTYPGRIVKLDRADAPSVSFPNPTNVGTTDTTDGPRTVSVFNIGNQPLVFTTPDSGSNPSYPANSP